MSEKEKKNLGLENQLFSWTGWDPMDAASYNFYECTLKHDIGNFKAGDKISSIFFSVESSIMEFYNEEGTEVIGKFKLTIDAQPWE